MWQFRSCVQFICRWQAIAREYSRLQNASFKPCNLKLSRLEFFWHSSNCFAKNADDGSSYSKLRAIFQQCETGPSFHTSRASVTKSGQIVWFSLMSIERDILCALTGKGCLYWCFDGIAFLWNSRRYMIWIKNLLYNQMYFFLKEIVICGWNMLFDFFERYTVLSGNIM